MRILTVIVALALLASAGAHAAGSIEKLRAFVDQTRSAQGRFTQEVSDKSGKKLQTSSGKLAFQRPGKFRWTYEKPFEQLVVGDGEKLWLYDKDLNQVTVKKLDAALGSSPAALLAGSNDIEEMFALNAKGMRAGLDWLEAYPNAPDSMFEKIRMGFGGSNLEVMELYDHLGQKTVIKISKLQRNPKLAADMFKFTPPEGADVVGD